MPSDLGRVWYRLPKERQTPPALRAEGRVLELMVVLGKTKKLQKRKTRYRLFLNGSVMFGHRGLFCSSRGAHLRGHGNDRAGGGRRTGTRTGGGHRTGDRDCDARCGSRSAPTYAEHGRLQRILRSLGLGRVWFCAVFSVMNTSR